MTTPKDGGAAFPIPGGEGYPGMSIRDYFIAHAPVEPQSWFEAVMPERPKGDPNWQWCDNCKADIDECLGNASCKEMRIFFVAESNWLNERRKQQLVQWPAAWADAMLEERERLK